MRAQSLWRILLCVLLAWQLNAMAFAQMTMGLPQDSRHTTAVGHAQGHCHEQIQSDDNSAAHRSMSHASDGHKSSTTQPDCCKSSHCQCHCVHTPALSIALISVATSVLQSPALIDLATPHALMRVSDSLRPPISQLS